MAGFGEGWEKRLDRHRQLAAGVAAITAYRATQDGRRDPRRPGTAGRDYRTPEQPHPWTPVAADVGQRVTCTCGRERDQHGGRNGLSGDLRAA
jgi:hypothetical protein